jgi:hypothetical protein
MRFQIRGVRSLFALVLIAAVGVGWFTYLYRSERVQEAAIRAVEEEEVRLSVEQAEPGWLDYLRRPRIRVVAANFALAAPTSLRPTMIDALRVFPHLESIDFGGMAIDDSQLELVACLPSLRALFLQDTEITAKGLAHLSRLKYLEVLNLSHCVVNSESVCELEKISNLRRLMLRYARVKSETLDLARLSKLEQLDLSGCKLDFAEKGRDDSRVARWIGGSLSIKELYLEHWAISEHDVRALTALPNLRLLDLCGCDISDAATSRVSGFHKLQGLGLPPWALDEHMISSLKECVGLKDLWVDGAETTYFITITTRPSDPPIPDWEAKVRQVLPTVQIHKSGMSYAGLRGEPGSASQSLPDLIGSGI